MSTLPGNTYYLTGRHLSVFVLHLLSSRVLVCVFPAVFSVPASSHERFLMHHLSMNTWGSQKEENILLTSDVSKKQKKSRASVGFYQREGGDLRHHHRLLFPLSFGTTTDF